MKFGYTIIYVNSVTDMLAFVTDDVQAAYQNAVDCGASPIRGPVEKSWGQILAYVCSIEGTLIKLCSPVDARFVDMPIRGGYDFFVNQGYARRVHG